MEYIVDSYEERPALPAPVKAFSPSGAGAYVRALFSVLCEARSPALQ